jgi:undecaprenyl-phosphate 4-deoxy-4-formamido-L-arabinose transferase
VTEKNNGESMTPPKISIVVPVFNEETNIVELINRCLTVCDQMERPFELILVDDGSSDASAKAIEDASGRLPKKVVGVLLNRNYGQHAAVRAGLSHADGDIVVTLDADLQNPPEEIPKIVDKVDQGYDVVGTIRIPRCDTLFRRFSSYLVNKMVRNATGVIMHDYGCMLRGYRRRVIDAVLACREQSTFLPVLANRSSA